LPAAAASHEWCDVREEWNSFKYRLSRQFYIAGNFIRNAVRAGIIQRQQWSKPFLANIH